MLPTTTQVLIVGAGPSGLALGPTLAARHIQFVLIERLAEGQLFLSDDGLMVVAPFANGHHRIIATLDEPPKPQPATISRRSPTRGPRGAPAKIRDVAWSSRFRIHHGVAKSYRSGRMFLAGDAAHVHSPAGGQGMNIGIQDVCDLGDRLAAVLGGDADDAQLAGYEAARRPVAEQIVAMTDRLTRVATMQGPVCQELRNLAIEVVGHLPRVRRKLAEQFSELNG
ncbi:MAG: FAD-dependent monooxygenase [Pseudomonadota bacterium]|nr:FAD-dependent monooxygenase [Pseudomonadota bacterium]